MSSAILYSGTKNASSWAMRAWLALRAAEFEFVEEIIDIRRPQRFQGLEWIGTFSPSATVPALVLDDSVIFDSMAIMEFANEVASGRLLPCDLAARAKARSIVAWQHAGLSAICSRISFESSFYPAKRRLTPAEEEECARLFEFLERTLVNSGGPYLFASCSLADFALAPAVVRLSRHQAPTDSFPAVALWIEVLLYNPLVREWMIEADKLPHIWLDDYLVPGDPWREAAKLHPDNLIPPWSLKVRCATEFDRRQIGGDLVEANFASN